MKKMRFMKKNMSDGHAWIGSEHSDTECAPSAFSECPTTLERITGLCDTAFCAQPLRDVDTVRLTPSPSDSSTNILEKQDSSSQVDCATSPPLLKRPLRSPHIAPKLRASHHRLGRSPNKGLPRRTPHRKVQSVQKSERSSSAEHNTLPQHHKAALCVF